MRKPKLGHIGFLNVLPLTYSFNKEKYANGLEIESDVPAITNRDLVNNQLDVSQVSSIVYARNYKKLLMLPDVCVRSEGAVTSILLVSRKPITEITTDRIILTAMSATSHALLKIILHKGYGATPDYDVRHITPKDPVPDDATGSLFIGDYALYIYHHKDAKRFYYYDLGTEWKKLTGHNMVYAIWAANRNFAAKHPDSLQMIYDRVHRGLLNGYHKKSGAIHYIIDEKPFTYSQLSRYLEVIKWNLDDAYLADLETFYRNAYEEGLIDEMPTIELAPVKRTSEEVKKQIMTGKSQRVNYPLRKNFI